MTLPYRRNVGAVLFGPDGRVLVARRAPGNPAPGAWQFPQGGIDEGEAPEAAVLRELAEEIGTDRVEILGAHPDWLSYDFPAEARRTGFGRRYRGQTQRWFALRFTGRDADIRLDMDRHVEFDAWRWVALADVPRLAPAFKRPIYEVVAGSFAQFATPG